MTPASPLLTAQSLSIVPDATHKGTTHERLKAAADDYESVFLSTMLSQMFSGLPTDGPFHGGSAEETWRGMLVNEYGKELVKSGGIGLSQHIYKELLHLQEGGSA
jgi:peptidoglycan hydrolase FlgJ